MLTRLSFVRAILQVSPIASRSTEQPGSPAHRRAGRGWMVAAVGRFIRLRGVAGALFCLMAMGSTIGIPGARASTITINPGPVGSIYQNQSFAFSDLNGTSAAGQSLSLDFVFPSGIDAAYRYDHVGAQALYGWTVALNFVGGGSVSQPPITLSVVPLDGSNTPVGPFAGTTGLYNASFAAYIGNYNTTFSAANLVAFENVSYHGVRMTLQLPVNAGAVVSSGSFSFNRNGSGESTEIISAIPEPGVACLVGIGLLIMGIHPRRDSKSRAFRASIDED